MTDSLTAPSTATDTPAAPAPLRTWHVFAILTLVSIAVSWFYQERVMTAEVYHALLGDQLTPASVDLQLASVQRYLIWAYLATPLVLALRLCAIALVAQTLLMLGLVDVTFGKLFRAASFAFAGVLYGTVFRVGWLATLSPSEMDRATLGITPLSLSALFLTPTDDPDLWYWFCSQINGFELLWAAIFYLCLRSYTNVGRVAAAGYTSGVWLVVLSFQAVVAVYLASSGM